MASLETGEPVQNQSKRLPIGWLIILTCVLLPLSFAIPRFEVDSAIVRIAFLISESGSKYVLPFDLIFLVALFVARPNLQTRQRCQQGVIVLMILIIAAGAAAKLNEHFVKPGFAVPRPDIVEMADAGILGMTVESFYALPNKEVRSEHLSEVLDSKRAAELRLPSFLHEHWIEETGFSFPSGHSLAAMTVATFFVLLAARFHSGWKRNVFCLTLPWAMLVCWSRPVLHVHSAIDVTCGGLAGAVVGSLVSVVAIRILGRIEKS